MSYRHNNGRGCENTKGIDLVVARRHIDPPGRERVGIMLCSTPHSEFQFGLIFTEGTMHFRVSLCRRATIRGDRQRYNSAKSDTTQAALRLARMCFSIVDAVYPASTHRINPSMQEEFNRKYILPDPSIDEPCNKLKAALTAQLLWAGTSIEDVKKVKHRGGGSITYVETYPNSSV